MTVFAMASLMIPDVSAMCAEESIMWWETCSDAKEFSNDVHIKNTILFLVLIVFPVSCIALLVIWRKIKYC